MRKVTLPALIILFVLQARPANNFALTVDNIMRGPALVGYEPTAVRWSHDSSRISTSSGSSNTDKEIAPMDTYTVNRDGSGLRKLTDEELKLLPPALGETTKDKRLMVYSSAGDLYHPRQHHRQSHSAHQDHRRRNQSPLHPGRQTHFLHPQRQPLRDVAG